MTDAQNISPVGLPHQLEYTHLPTIPDSAKAYDVSVSPDNNQILTWAGVTNILVQNSFGASQSITPQQITFTLSTPASHSVFLDPKETTLTGRLAITPTFAQTIVAAGANIYAKIISSFASWFSTLQLYCNNVMIENINNYDLLYNLLLNSTTSISERQGGLTMNLGCDPYTQSGIDIVTPLLAAIGTTTYINFSIPLLSIIGLNTAGASNKLFPIGSVNNLQLVMTTTSTLPIASSSTNNNAQVAGIYTFTMDQMNLNCRYLDIGDVGLSLFRSSINTSKYYIRSQSYVSSNASIANGSSGNLDLALQIRNASVRSMWWYFGIARSAVCPNGYFDAVNPSLSSAQMKIGGLCYPNKPLNPNNRPAECFEKFLQSFGGLGLKSYGNGITRSAYGVTIPAVPAGGDNILNLPAVQLRTTILSGLAPATVNVVAYPNMHYEGVDLERANGALMSGLNTRSSPPVLSITLSQLTTSAITCFGFGLVDCIIEIDPETKMVRTLM